MAFVLGDRARETLASAPGTGNFTTAGATQGAQSLASVLTSNGDTAWATLDNGTAWETNTITRVSATVYSRGTPFASSNAGALVNFTSGTIEVFIDLPASKIAPLNSFAGLPAYNYLSGLTLTWLSTTTFSVAAGQAADSTNAYMIVLASALTKSTSAWAVGSGNGGLDTGTIANSTWYHVYLIRRPDTGVVDVLFSTSASAPTMPTNYTQKRRIGSVKTNGSAQFVAWTQLGDEFLWSVPVNDIPQVIAALGTAAILKTLTVPTGVQVTAVLYGRLGNVGALAPLGLWSSPDQVDTAPSATLFNVANPAGGPIPVQTFLLRTNTSAQVRVRISVSDASDFIYGTTMGWNDRRGRDG